MTVRSESPRRRALRAAPRPSILLLAAALLSLALNMWFGRGATFTSDELAWLMMSPHTGPEELFHPYVGHLIPTSKLLYKVVLELFGPEYWVFRLLAALTLVAAASVLFLLLRRLGSEWMALAVSVAVLFFGGDPMHSLRGNTITVVGAVGLGLLALLLLLRPGRWRAVLACLTLCLGVLTYSQALPFLPGIALFLILAGRARDLWVPAVPLALYGAWWVWARDLPGSSGSVLTLENLLLLPAWGFQSLSATAAQLSGLANDFGLGSPEGLGPALAVGLLAVLAVWLLRHRPEPVLLAGLLALGTMWGLAVVAVADSRVPEASRYLFPVLLLSALVWGIPLGRVALHRRNAWLVAVITGVICMGGVVELRNYGEQQRSEETVMLRSGLGALELADPDPSALNAASLADQETELVLNQPFRALDDLGLPSVSYYFDAVSEYGPVGFPAGEIAAQGPEARDFADLVLMRALATGLPAPAPLPPRAGCVPATAAERGVPLPAGRPLVVNRSGRPAGIALGRFSGEGVPIADLAPRSAVEIGVGPGARAAGLRLYAWGEVEICPPR